MGRLPRRTSDEAGEAHALGKRIAGIHDFDMRVSYLKHELVRLSADDIAELLEMAVDGSELKAPPHPELLLALTLALADVPDVRQAIVRAAAARGLMRVVQLLSRRDAQETPSRTHNARNGLDDSRPLTLGERKALARKRDRRLIARAIRDPDPAVIGILLGNPALTEEDVVRLCARRPVSAEVLRSVFRSTRWIVRYRVRRAIVLNPHTPLDVSLPLAVQLSGPDARLVMESTELAPELRMSCERAHTVH
jgi:hypothetical protein